MPALSNVLIQPILYLIEREFYFFELLLTFVLAGIIEGLIIVNRTDIKVLVYTSKDLKIRILSTNKVSLGPIPP